MKEFTLISLAFLSSVFLGCSSTNSKSLLEERAGYGFTPPQVGLRGSGGVKFVPTRVPEKMIVAWLHEKELSPTSYFWGSWLSIVAVPETWEMKKVAVQKTEKKQTKRTPEQPVSAPPKARRP